MREDLLNKIFGLDFMDEMHDYPNIFSNIRYYHKLKARIINKFIQKNNGLNKLFLDSGAGRGSYCVIASPLFKKVYCDEFDKKELNKAQNNIIKRNLRNIEFINNDLTKLSYQDNYIDVAVCSEVLEHIPNKQKAAEELYRVIKHGGRLLVSMPQKNSLFYRHVQKVHKDILGTPEPLDTSSNLWHFMQHVKFSTRDIEKLMTDAGFKIINRYGANVLPPGEKIFSVLYKFPPVFRLYISLEFFLEKALSRFASFYFIELTK